MNPAGPGRLAAGYTGRPFVFTRRFAFLLAGASENQFRVCPHKQALNQF